MFTEHTAFLFGRKLRSLSDKNPLRGWALCIKWEFAAGATAPGMKVPQAGIRRQQKGRGTGFFIHIRNRFRWVDKQGDEQEVMDYGSWAKLDYGFRFCL